MPYCLVLQLVPYNSSDSFSAVSRGDYDKNERLVLNDMTSS